MEAALLLAARPPRYHYMMEVTAQFWGAFANVTVLKWGCKEHRFKPIMATFLMPLVCDVNVPSGGKYAIQGVDVIGQQNGGMKFACICDMPSKETVFL